VRVTVIPRVGAPPVVLEASQFVAEDDLGTPIAVGAAYGPDGAYAVSCVGCPDFRRVLRALGVDRTVVVDRLVLPRPQPGARLLAGPAD